MQELQAEHGVAVTPNDSTDLSGASRTKGFLIYVGVGGDVVVDTIGGETSLTFKNMASGTILPVRVARVRTASTATNMVALS